MAYSPGYQAVQADVFDSMFQFQYQRTNKSLPPALQNFNGINGQSFNLPITQQFTLGSRGAYSSDLTPTIVQSDNVIVTFNDFASMLLIDQFQQSQILPDVKMNQMKNAAASVARREDQIVIDRMSASTPVATIPDGGTNLTVEKLRETAFTMDENNIPPTDRYYVGHASQKKSLLAQTEVTSSDYAEVKALVQGQVDTFLGFKFIWFGNMVEGGIPKVGNIRTNFAFHMDAFAYVKTALPNTANPGIDVDWLSEKRSWAVIPVLQAGCQLIQAEGFVKVECDETA